jgi:hypothetical protein
MGHAQVKKVMKSTGLYTLQECMDHLVMFASKRKSDATLQTPLPCYTTSTTTTVPASHCSYGELELLTTLVDTETEHTAAQMTTGVV